MENISVDDILKFLTAASNVFTIGASGLAIYLFIAKREVIFSVIKVLVNYSFQSTLDDFRAKLDRLNDFSTDDPAGRKEVISILHEITGLIQGNKLLKRQFDDMLRKVTRLAGAGGRLNNARKRAIISELRERLKSVNVENIADLIGEKK